MEFNRQQNSKTEKYVIMYGNEKVKEKILNITL